MKKHKVLFWLILIALGACELIVAWKVPGFSDYYVEHIFPVFGAVYGRFSGLFKFSIGEFMLYGAVIYTALTLLIWMTRFVAWVDKSDRFKTLSRVNTKIFVKLLIVIALLQIQNCFVLYHTSPIYSGTEYDNYVTNREDLIDLREKLVKQANALSAEFERNDKGEIVYDADLASLAIIAMQGYGENSKVRYKSGEGSVLDEKTHMLAGYYSAPKPFLKSDFFSQQYIKGYYFPFSLEANYNDMMYIVNIPDTMCHELSHLQGFIYEDEASFLAYLGCINSNDKLFEYSGIMNALSYVNKEVKKELAVEPDIRNSLTPVSELVSFDSVFLTDEAWEEVESDALIKTDTVHYASTTFLETNLTVNGVSDGIISYSRMVNLLLKYYYGGVE